MKTSIRLAQASNDAAVQKGNDSLSYVVKVALKRLRASVITNQVKSKQLDDICAAAKDTPFSGRAEALKTLSIEGILAQLVTLETDTENVKPKKNAQSRKSFALLNATRWHSSVFCCYQYVEENFASIVAYMAGGTPGYPEYRYPPPRGTLGTFPVPRGYLPGYLLIPMGTFR